MRFERADGDGGDGDVVVETGGQAFFEDVQRQAGRCDDACFAGLRAVVVARVPNPCMLLVPGWTFSRAKDRAVIVRGEWDASQGVTLWANAGQGKFDFDALASSVYTVTDRQGTFMNNFAHQRDRRDRQAASAGLHARFATGGVAHQLAASVD